MTLGHNDITTLLWGEVTGSTMRVFNCQCQGRNNAYDPFLFFQEKDMVLSGLKNNHCSVSLRASRTMFCLDDDDKCDVN